MNNLKISYAITVCNEIEEIKNLFTFLKTHKRPQDEIVILYDVVNGSKEVLNYLRTITLGLSYDPIDNYPIRWYSYDFNGDFSQMKNFLTDMCTGDYIFNIDADELPSEKLIEAIPHIIDENPLVDVILVPRINTVERITQEHIDKWGWDVTPEGWINWPDFQWRVYRNSFKIKWVNKVHERLNGFGVFSTLPQDPVFALKHHKTIERQVKQNNYYTTL